MSRLNTAQRIDILKWLVEGASLRAISRNTGASINTVTKLLVDAGTACAAFHHEHVRNVRAQRVQADEIWTFTYAKQKNVERAKKAPAGAGDTWTWTGIDADSKLVISWLVGPRDGQSAYDFMMDMAERLAGPRATHHGRAGGLRGSGRGGLRHGCRLRATHQGLRRHSRDGAALQHAAVQGDGRQADPGRSETRRTSRPATSSGTT